jgi:hypothetical protein
MKTKMSHIFLANGLFDESERNMYNPANSHFIFRQSSGEVLDFYQSERFGLCYSSLTKKNIWTNPVSVNRGAHPSFAADMDPEDRFHILLQDLQGNLHYVLMDGSAIKTIPVLSSRTPAVYDKHLQLIPLKDEVHLFYILRQEKAPILSHQILGAGKSGNPRVVDYVCDNSCPAAVIRDGHGDILAIYQASDGTHLQLGEKKYDAGSRTWGEFTPITEFSGDCGYPKVVQDSDGNLHLCYQRSLNGQFELVYRQKKSDSNQWSGEILIHNSINNFENASIMWLNNTVIVYWLRDGVIYCRVGYQSGNSWGKAYRYSFPYKGDIQCLKYKTNFQDEAGKTSICNIPGSLTSGLKLAFYRFIPNAGDTMTIEGVRDLIMESFRILRDTTEELRISTDELRETTEQLKEENARLLDELSTMKNRLADVEKDLVMMELKPASRDKQRKAASQ